MLSEVEQTEASRGGKLKIESGKFPYCFAFICLSDKEKHEIVFRLPCATCDPHIIKFFDGTVYCFL